MPWISSEITYDDAVARGLNIWEVLYDNWGNANVADSDTFPPLGQKTIPTVFGVSIGSRSMVDRVFVSYDRQKNIQATYPYLREASVQAPLLFSQPAGDPAPVVVNPPGPPFAADSVAIFAQQQSSTSADVTDSNFVFLQFRNSLGGLTNYATAPTSFVLPRLQLYFHLKPGIVVSTARAPQVCSQVDPVLLASGRHLVAVVPVCGRKRVAVTTSCTQITDLEIGFIQNTSGAAEVIVGTAAAVPALNPRRFVIDPADGDFVTIYATPAANGQLSWTVTAHD